MGKVKPSGDATIHIRKAKRKEKIINVGRGKVAEVTCMGARETRNNRPEHDEPEMEMEQ